MICLLLLIVVIVVDVVVVVVVDVAIDRLLSESKTHCKQIEQSINKPILCF